MTYFEYYFPEPKDGSITFEKKQIGKILGCFIMETQCCYTIEFNKI